MKRNKILSSAFVMTMVSFGAFAADGTITGGAGTCTVDVLGVYDNNATANTIATWTLNKYNLTPGQYLSVTDTSVDKATCPAGSYCVGGEYTVENASGSVASCPTNYPSSDAAASSDTQCYTACTVATANIAHATAVSGNDYYGTGTDTCGATACETGYHVDGGGVEIIERTPLVDINYKGTGTSYFAAIDANGAIHGDSDLYDELSNRPNNSWVLVVDQTLIYGIASCQPIMGNNEMDTKMNLMMDVLSGVISIEEYKTTLEPIAGVAKTNLAADLILAIQQRGIAGLTDDEYNKLATLSALRDVQFNTTDIGPYCFCRATAAKNIDGVTQNIVSAPWLVSQQSLFEGWDASRCATGCAVICAGILGTNSYGNDAFRGVMFGALDLVETGGICAANTINIDWNPDNGGAHTQNMCTYDGAITLPTPDPVKPGYTFMGWKLLEENK